MIHFGEMKCWVDFAAETVVHKVSTLLQVCMRLCVRSVACISRGGKASGEATDKMEARILNKASHKAHSLIRTPI